ncbi:MAG: type II toxin-antitoxin system prevent-host-death family antitoxin [Candidatus Promineofilum sp.]|nr:type II toxin-antitoxin system prevent-host-death family antitoxin [Promineifilum sp.]
MAQLTVGVRDLKAQLSEYLRQVKEGETVIITEHGHPIGRIIPEPESVAERLQRLVDSGELLWDGAHLPAFEPVAINEGQTLIADIVTELRE